MKRLAVLLLVVLALSPRFLPGQTTGSVIGRVMDDQGGGLPGVTIEARGPALPGTQIVISQIDGSYRLALLPPGAYVIAASLPAFGRSEQNVVVPLDRTVTADLRLRATAKESIVVSGEAPVVDTNSTSLGTNLNTRQIETLPSGRNYTSIVQV